MSKSRTNVKVAKTARNSLGQFARRLGRLVFVSKPVIQNPKWEEGQATKNVPQFIVAPWKGRSFKKVASNPGFEAQSGAAPIASAQGEVA